MRKNLGYVSFYQEGDILTKVPCRGQPFLILPYVSCVIPEGNVPIGRTGNKESLATKTKEELGEGKIMTGPTGYHQGSLTFPANTQRFPLPIKAALSVKDFTRAVAEPFYSGDANVIA